MHPRTSHPVLSTSLTASAVSHMFRLVSPRPACLDRGQNFPGAGANSEAAGARDSPCRPP